MDLSIKKSIAEDIFYKSLIGRKIKIINSVNKSQIGIEGFILFESVNFFYIGLKDESTIKILKKNISFEMPYKGKTLNIDGRFLTNTVLSRIKKIK